MPRPRLRSIASLLLLAGLVIWGAIFRKPAPAPVGEELLPKYSAQYVLIGQKLVDKEIAGLTGPRKVPALFIYLLQDRSNPERLLVSISQSEGYSIGQITIAGSALSVPVTVNGEGRFWSNLISIDFAVPNKSYEQELVVSKLGGGEVDVTVNYFWIIWQGAGEDRFQTRSDTTKAVFSKL